MVIHKHIAERILQGKPVTMEVPAHEEQLRCFIGVYPIITNDGTLKIHVRMFGIDRKFLDNDWDVQEEDMVDRKKEVVYGLPELESLIVRWGADPAGLEYPWR